MNDDFGVQLRELAEKRTRGIELVHPASIDSPSPRRPHVVLLVAATVTLLVGVLGVLWDRGGEGSTVVENPARDGDAETPRVTAPLSDVLVPAPVGFLSILRQDPTPEADLPAGARDFFDRRSLPRSQGAWPAFFSSLHRVDWSGGLVSVVGLDSTGMLICQFIQTAEDANAGIANGSGGCSSPLDLASLGGVTLRSNGDVRYGLVGDDVVEVVLGGVTAEIVDNMYFVRSIGSPIGLDLLRSEGNLLRYSDGTSSVPLGSVPAGVLVTGSHNGRQLEEPFLAGCAIFDSGFSAKAALRDAGAVFTVELDQSHVRITDSIDGTEATALKSDGATITTVSTPDGLEIHASWATDDSVGDIRIECGRNHIDTSSSVAD